MLVGERLRRRQRNIDVVSMAWFYKMLFQHRSINVVSRLINCFHVELILQRQSINVILMPLYQRGFTNFELTPINQYCFLV